MIKTIVRENNYMDSIFLMNVTRSVMQIEGVKDALVIMGTDMNKTVLDEFGGLSDRAKQASANDLIISLDIDDEGLIGTVESHITKLMTRKEESGSGEELTTYHSFGQATEDMPDSNLVVISLPGEFAAGAARSALEKGKHVFMFSDNVPLEEEKKIKEIARSKNLLMMGPGAGTAVIDNIAVGLMSKIRPGSIGIVAASGSGLQEVAMLVHQFGMGISQAIGTGGRDLSKEIGGSTMLQGIEYLEQDTDTEVIVLISKPPHPETAAKIFEEVKKSAKPVIVFFLGGDPEEIRKAGAYAASTLEEAARIAVKLAGKEPADNGDFIFRAKQDLVETAEKEKKRLCSEQKYLRGLFCGGTHSEEAVLLLQDFVPDLHSNLNFGKVSLLENRHLSLENSLVDMGDEEFTKGKPHPVMDPSILNTRLLQEADDPTVGVILFDILLGYGVHKDPVGTIEETLRNIKRDSEEKSMYISLVASVCGTDLDPQGLDNQIRRLEDLGVTVLQSNGRAALLAGLIVS